MLKHVEDVDPDNYSFRLVMYAIRALILCTDNIIHQRNILISPHFQYTKGCTLMENVIQNAHCSCLLFLKYFVNWIIKLI